MVLVIRNGLAEVHGDEIRAGQGDRIEGRGTADWLLSEANRVESIKEGFYLEVLKRLKENGFVKINPDL